MFFRGLTLCVLVAVLAVLAAPGLAAEQTRQEKVDQQRAQQEQRKRLIKQQQEQKQLRLEQLQVQQEQRQLTQQQIQQQNILMRRQQQRARLAATQQQSKRNQLVGDQRGVVQQSAERGNESELRRQAHLKRLTQQQNEEYPALKRHLESLNRQTVRDQQKRSEAQ